MLKACSYCGKVHAKGYACSHKPQPNYTKRITYIDRFRSTKAWQHKRDEIKQRDKYCCQICSRKLHNTVSQQYNSKDLQVHHIQKIRYAWDKRLDNDNLVSLCPYHHKMADDGLIKAKQLLDIVFQQEQAYNAL